MQLKTDILVIAETLLKYDARKDLKNHNGQTPLDVIQLYRSKGKYHGKRYYNEVIALLENKLLIFSNFKHEYL